MERAPFIFLLNHLRGCLPTTYEKVYPNGMFTKQILKVTDNEIGYSGIIFSHPLWGKHLCNWGSIQVVGPLLFERLIHFAFN